MMRELTKIVPGGKIKSEDLNEVFRQVKHLSNGTQIEGYDNDTNAGGRSQTRAIVPPDWMIARVTEVDSTTFDYTTYGWIAQGTKKGEGSYDQEKSWYGTKSWNYATAFGSPAPVFAVDDLILVHKTGPRVGGDAGEMEWRIFPAQSSGQYIDIIECVEPVFATFTTGDTTVSQDGNELSIQLSDGAALRPGDTFRGR